jgi:hypothetical protein
MTTYRYHIVDETLHRLWVFIPFQVACYGRRRRAWLWFDFLIAWVGLAQHSEWDWSSAGAGGCLSVRAFIVCTHSTRREGLQPQFLRHLLVLDDLFGTAERNAEPPTVYGGRRHPVRETLLGQFVYPFAKIAHDLRHPGQNAAPAPATPASDAVPRELLADCLPPCGGVRVPPRTDADVAAFFDSRIVRTSFRC